MNLDLLKEALQPLNDYGKQELQLEVNNTTVVLRPLLPREEIECQKYAASLLADLQDETENSLLARHAALDYFDKFRIEVISYSLIQIGNTDLRNITTIDTGEVLPNGVQKKLPRQLALRNIITENWSRAMITICFSKYGDLISNLAEEAEKTVEMSISDLDAEIERVKVKLNDLQEERDKRLAGDPSITKQQISNLVEIGQQLSKEVEHTIKAQEERIAASEATSAAEYVEQLEKQVEPDPVQQPTRQSVIPHTTPPPTTQVEPPVQHTQEQVTENSKPEAVASINGVDAFRLPTQTLSQRGDTKSNSINANPDPRVASRNPNYKPRM